jgi:hypothetical protein
MSSQTKPVDRMETETDDDGRFCDMREQIMLVLRRVPVLKRDDAKIYDLSKRLPFSMIDDFDGDVAGGRE